MKRILILTDIGFSSRDYVRFGLEILKKKYQVEILDFTEWLSPEYWKSYEEKIFHCDGYKKILNQKDFEKSIKEKNIISIIDFLSSDKSYLIKNYFKKNEIPITKVKPATVLENKRTFTELLLKLFFLILDPKALLKKILMTLNTKLINNKSKFSYNYLIISGLAGLNTAEARNAKKIIKAHSFDYDIFLKSKDKTLTLQKEPYAVFLDQYLPFHPAAIWRKEKSQVTAENYYSSLNNFFKSFENKTGLEVIFAAHPRSRYDLWSKYLYGRKYFLFKTPELVKNSKIVLLHTSTAISFAILYNKPIIFLTSNEYKKSFDDFRINSYSRTMNSLLFNIDDRDNYSKIPNENEIFSFDKNKYKEYKDEHLKHPGAPDNYLWNIFLDNIEKKV